MEQEPTAEKLPSRILEEMGFTSNEFVDHDVEPKTFDTINRGSEIVIIAYDQEQKEWALVSTEPVEALEKMMRERGFTPGPSPYAPRKEDPIN